MTALRMDDADNPSTISAHIIITIRRGINKGSGLGSTRVKPDAVSIYAQCSCGIRGNTHTHLAELIHHKAGAIRGGAVFHFDCITCALLGDAQTSSGGSGVNDLG